MVDFLSQLWRFARQNKKFWLFPMVMVLVVVGSLIVFAQGSVVAPFVYTLF